MERSGSPRLEVELERLPAVDGLRGIAILAVIAFHADIVGGGYLGVDLFFVVSGYLITRLLIAGGAPGSLVRFWGRRARRLLPLLTLVVGVVVLGAPSWSEPADLTDLHERARAVAVFVANWQAIGSNGYWAPFGEGSPLEHAWSLAVEEQVYLLLPLLLLAVRGARRPLVALATVALAGAAASMAWAMALFSFDGDVERVYLGTDTRAGAILVGVALAAIEVHRQREGLSPVAPPPLLVAVSIMFLGWSWIAVAGDEALLWQGVLVAHAGAVAVLVLVASGPARSGVLGSLRRALEWRPLTTVGVLSYGLYLWHWPLFLWLDTDATDLTGVALAVVRLSAVGALALLSYVLVEQPSRRVPLPTPRWLLAVPMSVALVFAATVIADDPPPPAGAVDVPQFSAGDTGQILVVGDSVGASFASGLIAARTPKDPVVVSVAAPGCDWHPKGTIRLEAGDAQVASTGCGTFDSPADALRSGLASSGPADVVIMFGNPGIPNLLIDGKKVDPCSAQGDALRESRLTALVQAAGGNRVHLVSTPRLTGDAVKILSSTEFPSALLFERTDCHNEVIETFAAAHSDQVDVIDLAGWLCPDGECRQEVGGAPARHDGMHFSPEGGALAGRWILDQFAAATAPSAVSTDVG